MKYIFVYAVLIAGSSAADSFIPMTPVGAECIPVTVDVEGEREIRDDVRRQLTEDIDFSGLLVTADQGYAEADVSVLETSGGYELEASVTAGDEMLMTRSYSGSSLYSLVHAFADDLVYDLTGEEGIASTWVCYVTRAGGNYALSVKPQDPRPARNVMVDDDVITTPAWSPDGGSIAFTSYRSGNADLWRYDFGESSASKIVDMQGLNSSPAWSPDGDRIALAHSSGGNTDIYILNLEQEEMSRLTLRSSIETSPSFSPTGRQLVYTSDRAGYPQLYIMDSSGGTAIRTTFSHGYCDSPSWSPDGNTIAYTAQVGGDFHIFVMDADGSNIRQVTFEGSLNEDPVWGPTGRHLAFSSDMDGGRSIYIIELNGLNMRRLSTGGDCYCPSWSPLGFR